MRSRVRKKLLNFFAQFSQHTYPKNGILIYQNRLPAGMFLLTEGIVKCFTTSRTGKNLTLNVYKPISFFPMIWVMNNKPDKYAYTALTPVKVYIAPKGKFTQFLRTEHEVTFDLLERIYQGLAGFYQRLETQLGSDAYLKLVLQLMIYARRFSAQQLTLLSLTHKQLAAETGLSRETVTRQLQKMQASDLVNFKQHHLNTINRVKLEAQVVNLF